MRKLTAGFASSLDGYIEGLNGEYDWILIDKEIDFAEQMKRFDTFFYGRRTYESVLKMNPKPTPGVSNYVFSNSLSEVHPAFQLVKGDVVNFVQELKKAPGKDIAIFGGASLLASMLDAQLVDEISVSIIPVLLGKGKPMVEALQNKIWLKPESTKTYGNGTIQISYSMKYK